jgi:hypothetical protein
MKLISYCSGYSAVILVHVNVAHAWKLEVQL